LEENVNTRSSGNKGVTRNNGKWKVIIIEKGDKVKGDTFNLGTFDSPEVAASIYARVGFILNIEYVATMTR